MKVATMLITSMDKNGLEARLASLDTHILKEMKHRVSYMRAQGMISP